MDDELELLKPAGLPADKQQWNIEDLKAYLIAMKAEIDRVEQIINQKTKVQMAADALFGVPSDQVG